MNRELPTLKNAERERNETQTLLRALMRGVQEGILFVGEDLRVKAFNNEAQRIFSHIKVNLQNARVVDITRNTEVHQAFQNALLYDKYTEVKVENRRGDKRIFDLRVAPLQIDDDERIAIGIFYDITRIERLEKIRQEFLSNVSHELRTPLTSILAYVETLEDGGIEDEANNRRFLGIIRKNAERMHSLINDILELSAIEAGKVIVKPRSMRLAPVVEEVRTTVQSEANLREISIINDVQSDVQIFADPKRLEQMLVNLVENAVKFNRDKGKVTIKNSVRKDGTNVISVEDTGEGIASEHLERVFERFYRTDRARSREVGGTGLGLSIVKHLAILHGGEAFVNSKIGEGSIFSIALPPERPAEK